MMEKRNTTLHEHKKGQSLVEFALILPLMVLLVAGLFDLGRAFYSLITITNAAREGARFGSLHPDDTQGICDATWSEAQSSGIDIDVSLINITCGDPPDTHFKQCNDTSTTFTCPEGPLTVDVNYDYSDMIFSFFFGSGISMHHQAEMLVP